MATADAKKVLQLKHQLKESCEGHTLLKVLKKLEELDITLDVLAETGIGKVVNSFRKHDEAGKLAKMLVNRWKKLVPKDSLSSRLEQPNGEVEETRKEENNRLSESSNSKKKSKNDHFGTERKMSHKIDIKSEIKPSKSKMYLNGERTKDNDLNLDSQTDKKYHGKDKTSSAENIKLKHESKKNEKISGIMSKQQSSSPTKVQATSLKATETHLEKMKKAKEKLIDMDAGEQNGNVSEMASMSFEAYLSYDLDPPKRKKSFSTAKNLKRLKIDHKENSQALESVKTSKTVTHTSLLTKLQAPEGSVMDLLSVPLPTSFPECEDVSQYQYFSEKKADRKVVEVFEEAPVFIGQRLKNKMQVYSGSKITYLPTMMTLYQQCIRALQNNIDALYEIGGVPFEILEPVVERCTPEQLLRIEECNPVYIGVTDHLWERHCLKDFRNAQLDEYESWRELYIRMSEERETKLKLLTKSIVSAHSGKPKGRQVKMAFIHSAAKPPRNVRIQQEIHGTAGPVTLPHPADKPSCVKLHECRGRSNFSEPSKPSPMSSGQAQDPRKMKRVAPMMAKSLKAFKKQLSRR